MVQRFTDEITTDPKILGEELKFPNGRIAPNRFLKAALTERTSTYDPQNPAKHGLPTPGILNLYDKWGHGQYGMILTGNVHIHPLHLEAAGNALIFKEGESAERRNLFRQWSKAIKQDGGLAVMQVSQGGRQTPLNINPTPWSASDVQLPGFGKPVPLTIDEIKTEVIDRFVYVAKYAYDTGFDGIQLHGAHGYLLAQFTSPTTNKRTDRYGGSLENRARLIVEIFEAIRKEIPAETGFLVGLKTNSVEFQADGTSVEDAIQLCQIFEDKGFDFVELSGGTYEKLVFHHVKESTKKREAFFLEFAEKIRPVFKNTVVYLTGGFRTVKAMVEAVQSGATQGIGLGRPITAEPDLPKKILSKSVASAIADKIDGTQFSVTVFGSNTQMYQAGKSSYEQADQDASFGISDFSDQQVLDRYLKAVEVWTSANQKLEQDGKVVHGVLEFE